GTAPELPVPPMVPPTPTKALDQDPESILSGEIEVGEALSHIDSAHAGSEIDLRAPPPPRLSLAPPRPHPGRAPPPPPPPNPRGRDSQVHLGAAPPPDQPFYVESVSEDVELLDEGPGAGPPKHPGPVEESGIDLVAEDVIVDVPVPAADSGIDLTPSDIVEDVPGSAPRLGATVESGIDLVAEDIIEDVPVHSAGES